MSKFCTNCGQELDESVSFCVNCGQNTTNIEKKETKVKKNKVSKNKIVAGLLGIFLGTFGVHNFYLGYNKKAIAQLLITLLSFGTLSYISSTWGVIEGIMILTGTIDKDSDGNKLID